MRLVLCVLTVATAAAPLLGDGVPCRYRQLVSSYEAERIVQQAWANDSELILASSRGLEFVDAQDPAQLTQIGLWDGAPVVHFEIDGDLAYAISENLLAIIDISDRSNPVLLGEVVDQFSPSPSIVHDGSLLFVNASSDISVIDISDPTQPSVVDHINSPSDLGSCEKLVVSEGLLYSAWSDYGIVVFDISDPMTATKVEQFELPSGAWDVVLIGDVLLVSGSTTGLVVLDATDPLNLSQIRIVGTTSAYTELSVNGSTLAAAGYDEGVVRFDISDPAFPVRTSSFDPMGITEHVAQGGGFTYSAYGRTVSVMDLNQDRSSPVLGELNRSGILSDFELHDSIIYLVDDDNGLLLIDVSDPIRPTIRSRVDAPSRLTHIDVELPFVYCTGAGNGRLCLYVFYVADPDNPLLLWSILDPTPNGEVCAEGDRVYIANGNVHIFEIPPSFRPEHLLWFDTPDRAVDIEVVGSIAYVACSDAGLQIFDLSDEQNPTLIGGYDEAGYMNNVDVHDGVAYISQASSLLVLDVSDPASPSLITKVDVPGSARGVDLSGDTMYVANGHAGTSAYDVSDLNSPVFLGVHDVPNGQTIDAVIAVDEMVYALHCGVGVSVLDFSDCPACPADLDGNGSLDFFDISAFLQLFNAQSSDADLNSDGSWDFFDISQFLQAFQAGC